MNELIDRSIGSWTRSQSRRRRRRTRREKTSSSKATIHLLQLQLQLQMIPVFIYLLFTLNWLISGWNRLIKNVAFGGDDFFRITEVLKPLGRLDRPLWLESLKCSKAKEEFLTPSEEFFWKELIEKYLRPIEKNEKKEVHSANKNCLKKKYSSVIDWIISISFWLHHISSWYQIVFTERSGGEVERSPQPVGVYVFHDQRYIRDCSFPTDAVERRSVHSVASANIIRNWI